MDPGGALLVMVRRLDQIPFWQAFGTCFAAAEKQLRTENGAFIMHEKWRREHLEEVV